MNDLIDNFDILMEAPGSIKRLRQMILQLAVKGRLVAQDPNDEPASILLEKIKAEKERLIKAGKLKPQPHIPPIKAEEIPYPIPTGWQWVRLGYIIIRMLGGGTPSKIRSNYWDGSIPWASVKDLSENKFLDKTIDSITQEGVDNSSTNVIPKGNVIVCTRMGLGKIVINRIDVAINQDLKALFISELIDINFFYNLYRTLNIIGSGMTVKGIKQEDLLNYLIPLPPIAEQERIVERVDRLMALCDELEKQQEERDKVEAGMNDACLDKLMDSSGDRDFQENWQRIVDHFDIIYEKPGNVEKLKQAILQLAVRGKLERQDPHDEPASILLEKIKQEKERLIKAGKLKPQPPIPPISEEEIPYPIPTGWQWVRLGEIIIQMLGGGTPSKIRSNYWDGNIPWASVKDLSENKFLDKTIDSITQEGVDNSSTNVIPKGNVIVCTRMGLGKIVINRIDVAINQDLKALFISELIDINFFYNLYRTLNIIGSGMTVKGIKQEDLLNYLIPLPPIAEQERIVERVDRLMALCDRLAVELTNAQTLRQKLFQAVVSKI